VFFPGDVQSCSLNLTSSALQRVALSAGPVRNLEVLQSLGFKGDPAWTAEVLEAAGGTPYLSIAFRLMRDANGFMYSLILPSILVTQMVTLLFLSNALPPRLQTSLIAVLALVALRARIDTGTRADYLWLDRWFIFNMVYMAVLFSCFNANWDSWLIHKALLLYHRAFPGGPPPDPTAQEGGGSTTGVLTVDVKDVDVKANSATAAARAKERLPSESHVDRISVIFFVTLYTIIASVMLSRIDWSAPAHGSAPHPE